MTEIEQMHADILKLREAITVARDNADDTNEIEFYQQALSETAHYEGEE